MGHLIEPRLVEMLFKEKGATEKELEGMSEDWIEQLKIITRQNKLECFYDEKGKLRYKLIRKGVS